MMTTNGPAIKSHGHGSRYHRRATCSTGNDEAGLFMTYHLLVVDSLNDELDLVRARTKFILLIVFVMLAFAARVALRVSIENRLQSQSNQLRRSRAERDRLLDANDPQSGQALGTD